MVTKVALFLAFEVCKGLEKTLDAVFSSLISKLERELHFSVTRCGSVFDDCIAAVTSQCFG